MAGISTHPKYPKAMANWISRPGLRIRGIVGIPITGTVTLFHPEVQAERQGEAFPWLAKRIK